MERSFQLQHVVGLFQKTGLDLLEVFLHITLPKSQNPKGDGFHHPEIALQTLCNAWILDFHGVIHTLQRGFVDLADRGPVGCLASKAFENLEGFFIEFASEGADHQRVGEGRDRILRLDELVRIGRRQEILVDAEHLGQLERSTFQLAESVINGGGVLLVQFPGMCFE